MPDFGVLKGIKSVLQSDEAIQNQGMDKKIYLTIPPQSSAPAVLIELEEVWSSIAMSRAAPQAKIKLRTSIVGEQGKKYLPVYIADHLQKIMDGLSLNLEDGKTAILKHLSSIIDFPKINTPQKVHQYFEAVVRR